MKQPTLSIRKLCPKPSDAVTAMCDGLIKQSRRRKFQVDMNTFGDADEDICYGCAATCTIQKIANKNLTAEEIPTMVKRMRALKLERNELERFEVAIDRLRLGSIEGFLNKFYPKFLFKFYKANEDGQIVKGQFLYEGFVVAEKENLDLFNKNWKKNLKNFRRLARRLKAAGL